MPMIEVFVPPGVAKYAADLQLFVEGMVKKLDKNSHKNTPDREQLDAMIQLLHGELAELEEQIELDKFDDNALVESQDVANFAFLIFTALRRDILNKRAAGK